MLIRTRYIPETQIGGQIEEAKPVEAPPNVLEPYFEYLKHHRKSLKAIEERRGYVVSELLDFYENYRQYRHSIDEVPLNEKAFRKLVLKDDIILRRALYFDGKKRLINMIKRDYFVS